MRQRMCGVCGEVVGEAVLFCPTCGEPIPTKVADAPPLQPIPDGGLAATMPDWLRESPSAPAPPPVEPIPSSPVAAAPRPATLIAETDVPQWMRTLATPRAAESASAPAAPIVATKRAITLPPAPEATPTPSPEESTMHQSTEPHPAASGELAAATSDIPEDSGAADWWVLVAVAIIVVAVTIGVFTIS